ncbi:MAG: 2-hydroxychromene-2-carboxylate isomerase [bacterium]
MKNILFYFDFISPYVYLATLRLPNLLQETSATLTCVPVLFAGLLNAHGQKGPAEISAKRRYTFIDCLRLAHHDGVPLQGPPTHPFNPLPSLRMSMAVEPGRRWDFVRRAMNAAWAEGKDISQPEMLVALADEWEFDGPTLWEKSQSPEVKEALKRNTEEAIQKGIFGVPSFEVEGELFWGEDRMELLKSFLLGKLPSVADRADSILARPSSAKR